jgi:hypothetical protein
MENEMKEYMEIGPSPYDEDCAQVGTENYTQIANKELDAYRNQLNRLFPDAESKGITFRTKWFNHDFGTYGEVCVFWNDLDGEANEYAYFIEANLPKNWDEQSIKKLELETEK